jgi:hypothetical protein
MLVTGSARNFASDVFVCVVVFALTHARTQRNRLEAQQWRLVGHGIGFRRLFIFMMVQVTTLRSMMIHIMEIPRTRIIFTIITTGVL